MPKLKDESFQAVSRGLLAHLPEMSSGQAKLYLYCLLRAKNQGAEKGCLSGYAVDVAIGLGWITKEFYRVLKSMEKYLEVEYAKSRHHPLKIKIKKFKALNDFYRHNIGDSSGDGKGDSSGDGKLTVSGRYADGNPHNTKKEKVLEIPKKEKKEKKDIIGRTQQFAKEIAAHNTYPKEILRAFYDYWSEPNTTRTKMKYELQKTWDLKRRLKRWADNNLTTAPKKDSILS